MTIFIIYREWSDTGKCNYLATTNKKKALKYWKEFLPMYECSEGQPNVEIWKDGVQVFGGPVHDEFWTAM